MILREGSGKRVRRMVTDGSITVDYLLDR